MAATLPALPEQLKDKYIKDFSLTAYDAAVICNDRDEAVFFEGIVKHTNHFKAAANWLIGPLKFYCNENNIPISAFPLSHHAIAELIALTESSQVNFNNASTKILQALIEQPGKTPVEIASYLNLLQENDSTAVEDWVKQVIADMPEKVKEFKSGKKGLIGLFSGEVKKLSKEKADMQLVNKILAEQLNQ